MSRYTSSSNPFEDEEDDFVYVPNSGKGRNPFDDRREQMSQMVAESENRQLESTQRAIASLYESEAMGNQTAEELLRQREVIQNIDKKTDEINTTLTASQRHINNIKSVFGGIKNWWTTKKETPQASSEHKPSTSLDAIVKKNQESASGSSYPASSSGQGWGSGSYSDADLDSRFMAKSSNSQSGASHGGASSLQYVQPITRSAREEELDRNLGMMSDGLGRLKMLAQGLGDEIEQQNEALDRLNPKVNRANDLLENQNKQMNRILKR